MRYSFVLFRATALMAASVALSFACVPDNIRYAERDDQNQTYPWAKLGSDAPSDPATTGYFMNHLSLNVRNLTKTMEFYAMVFGMRELFTFHISEHVSITYMGHAHGGRNGKGYQTAAEMNRQKNNIEGLIEFYFVDIPNKQLKGSTEVTNTLSHIGIVVPDIEETQKRLDEYGIEVIKGLDQKLPVNHTITKTTTFNDIFTLPKQEQDAAWAVLETMAKPTIFVVDPDGNLIEIQPETGAELV